MKNIIFRITSVAVVFGMAACSQNEEATDPQVGQTITELSVAAENTRSTLGDENWVEWDEADVFGVFTGRGFSEQFTVKELASDKHSAKLQGEISKADEYYILYPYDENAMLNNGSIEVEDIILQTQSLIEGTFGRNHNPAIGHTTGNENIAPMRNIAGLVKVHVTGEIDLRRIELKSNDQNELLCGDGTIDAQTGALTITEGYPNVALNTPDLITLDPAVPKDFIFVVAPQTLEQGFELVFSGEKEGKYYQFRYTTSNSATIKPSKILNITKIFDFKITNETVELDRGITYTANSAVTINDSAFSPAALDSGYDEETKTGYIYFEKGVTVTEVGTNAFAGSSLITLELPETIEKISTAAFQDCTELTQITNLDKVSEIGAMAFAGCSKLDNVTLSDQLSVIEDNTFADCTSLSSIDLSHVTSIGGSAFMNCTALQNATLNDSATSIGTGAFDGCSNLATVNIPNGLTEISGNLFRNCTSLAEASIPVNVTKIGSNAFYGCTALKQVYCKPMTPPEVYANSFPADNEDFHINVDPKALRDYQESSTWNQFFGNCIEAGAGF